MDVGIYRHGLLISGGNLFCFFAHLYVLIQIIDFILATNFGTKSDTDGPRFVPKTNLTFIFPIIGLPNFRGKTNLFFCSHNRVALTVGDHIKLDLIQSHDKHGTWTSTKPVVAYGNPPRNVTVTGRNSRALPAAAEANRPALPSNELSRVVQESLYILDCSLSAA